MVAAAPPTGLFADAHPGRPLCALTHRRQCALTLDGGGSLDAAWLFQMDSTLITSPGSAINVINTGSGAAVFWNVRSSATLDTDTAFMGNILALTRIGMNTGANSVCGRVLASTGAVTPGHNSLPGAAPACRTTATAWAVAWPAPAAAPRPSVRQRTDRFRPAP